MAQSHGGFISYASKGCDRLACSPHTVSGVTRPLADFRLAAQVISQRNSEIARVKSIQAALNASKASYRDVKRAVKTEVAITIRS